VLLTFDDASEGQYTNALPILRQHRFTATFFVMTVVLDKPRWLSRSQVRDLHRHGMTIGAHSWDRHQVTRYSGADWRTQLTRAGPRTVPHHRSAGAALCLSLRRMEQGRSAHVTAAGYHAAFQLNGRPDPSQPLLTIGRMLAVSDLNDRSLVRELKTRLLRACRTRWPRRTAARLLCGRDQ
jgi:hypothetical protein